MNSRAPCALAPLRFSGELHATAPRAARPGPANSPAPRAAPPLLGRRPSRTGRNAALLAPRRASASPDALPVPLTCFRFLTCFRPAWPAAGRERGPGLTQGPAALPPLGAACPGPGPRACGALPAVSGDGRGGPRRAPGAAGRSAEGPPRGGRAPRAGTGLGAEAREAPGERRASWRRSGPPRCRIGAPARGRGDAALRSGVSARGPALRPRGGGRRPCACEAGPPQDIAEQDFKRPGSLTTVMLSCCHWQGRVGHGRSLWVSAWVE